MAHGGTSPKIRSKTRDGSPGYVGAFNYELFELAHMLRVRPRTTTQQQDQSTTRLNTPYQPFIQVAVWHEDEYGCLLVLLCSNGSLLVWSVSGDSRPITKEIPWFQKPKRGIKALSLDPSGCWLVCACMDTHLYIVPLLNVVKAEGRVKPEKCPWKLDDITQVESRRRRREHACQPCSIVWWHTEDDFQMCIVGTELGEVMFVDLCTGIAILSVDLKESITTLELLKDKQHQVTSVMIGTASGETWQLILESKSLPQRRLSFDQMSSPSVASGLGYEMVGIMGIPLESFQAVTEWQDRLKPMPVKSPMGEVQFSVQHARNQVFIGAHNQRTDILQVYDTDVEHLPMFIYQLPSGTSEFILTDRLVFCVVHGEQGKTSLSILSSQLAETSQCVPRQRADSSIIQTFVLPMDEQVVGLFKLTKTMQGLSQADNEPGEGADNVLPRRVYSVDCCVLVTTSAVYECRPSVSPEKLFLDLAINNTDNTAADMLAITTGLDVNMLYQMAAEEALNQAQYEHAMKLYQLSKCPFSKRVAQFAKHKRIGDILTYLRQALSKHSDFHTAERKQLSNLALNCFLQQLLEFSGETSKHQELREAFSQFLNDNFDYDEYCALKLLASHGLKEHIFDVAKARGLMIEALEILYQTGQVHLSPDLLNKLAARGFTDVVSRSCYGAFLYSMDPKDAVNFLLTKPETILSHLTFLLHHLIALDEESLVHIARVLDPSRPSFRSLLAKLKTLSKSRSLSESSIASLASLESTVSLSMDENRRSRISDLLHLFLCTLLVLNHKREQEQDSSTRIANIQYVCGHPDSPNRTNVRKQGTVDMLCKRVRLSCGQQHTAVISASGDVYTWGKSHKGRLGHGDLIEEEGKSIPFRVEILHMHRIKVLSVACGIEHTLALCRDGVYAWGSSEYGQLGQGDNRQHTRPVFITELSDKSCIAVACGHYHSLALSADQRVWAWGWGVHGQLGMGTIEDVLLPSHVTALDHVQATQMAAGYSHTAVRTSEGQVYTFGGGLYGQLGLGTNKKQTLPRQVEALQDEDVYLICCGSFETIAVTSDQRVFNWGRSPQFFRLHTKPEFRVKRFSGQGSSFSGSLSHRLSPVEMDCAFTSHIKEIYCGNLHYLVVTETGQVYTWGYDDYGQLGQGKTMDDQLTPKAVLGLKDKHVVTASVGAEFSVAMDSNSHVFVWGRADSGQLGLDSSLIGIAKEVPVPTLLSSLPLLTNNDQQPSLPESSPSESSLDIDWKLPDLSVIGNRSGIYGRESLTLSLDALYPHYSPSLMLRHCLDINDYLSSSIIYNRNNQWSEALSLRLKFLAMCKKSDEGTLLGNSEFLDHTIHVINYSLSVVEDNDEADGNSVQLQHILMEILNFWMEHHLPQDTLESILYAHLTRMAYPLSILVIRNAPGTTRGSFTSSSLDTNGQPYRLKFSTKFLNTVVELVANEINSGEEAKEYNEDLSQMLMNEDDILVHGSFTIGQPEESQMSKNQLLQGIMDNLKKDLEKCSYISLSMTTAATIAAAAVLQQREWRNDNSVDHIDKISSPDAVVFTCNHHFPRVYFMDNILPEFQQRMSELLVPLVNTTKTLITHYKKSKTQLLAACPVCVYNSLRSEQLEKASDANKVIGEGFKAKPWDI